MGGCGSHLASLNKMLSLSCAAEPTHTLRSRHGGRWEVKIINGIFQLLEAEHAGSVFVCAGSTRCSQSAPLARTELFSHKVERRTAQMADVKASLHFLLHLRQWALISCLVPRCTKWIKRGCAQDDLIQVSLPVSWRGFHIVTLSFEAHNSVWNSLWPIVNDRTGCPFGAPKILGGL